MKLAKDDLVAALRLRYDHYSAQTMLESSLSRAELPLKETYDDAEIAAFRAALSRIGDRLASVDARLDALAGSAPAAPAKPALAAPVRTEENAAPTASAAEPIASAAAAAPITPTPTPAATDANAAASPTVETVITLTGVPATDDDDRVLVCGGLPELGDWDVTRAQPMVREGERWLATLALPAGVEAPFKFVRCAADGSATWEAGANRSLIAVPSLEMSWQ